MAPYSAPFRDKNTIGQIKIPSLYLAGSKDDLIPDEDVAASFSMANSPASFVLLKGAGHFAYTELDMTYQQTIATMTISFFDRTLRGRRGQTIPAEGNSQVVRVLTK